MTKSPTFRASLPSAWELRASTGSRWLGMELSRLVATFIELAIARTSTLRAPEPLLRSHTIGNHTHGLVEHNQSAWSWMQ
jgi:hypothetical protein